MAGGKGTVSWLGLHRARVGAGVRVRVRVSIRLRVRVRVRALVALWCATY